MRILGLDQSTTYTGYCVIEDSNIISTGSIEIKKNLKLNLRIIKVCDYVDILLQKYNVDYLALEDIYYCPGRFNAFRALAMLRGALIREYWLKKSAYPIIVSASSARKHIGITGKPTKKDIIDFLNKSFNLELDNEHIADAVVVAKIGYGIANKNLSPEFFEVNINLDMIFGRKNEPKRKRKRRPNNKKG